MNYYRIMIRTASIISLVLQVCLHLPFSLYSMESVWIGTWTGLNRIVKEKITGVPLPGDLPGRAVSCLLECRNGCIWAGTLGSGACRLKDGEIEVFNTGKGLSDNIVTCFHQDREGTLWIGSLKGLNRFKHGGISGLFKKNGLPDDAIRVQEKVRQMMNLVRFAHLCVSHVLRSKQTGGDGVLG